MPSFRVASLSRVSSPSSDNLKNVKKIKDRSISRDHPFLFSHQRFVMLRFTESSRKRRKLPPRADFATKFPPEISQEVFSCLLQQDLLNAALVSRLWHKLYAETVVSDGQTSFRELNSKRLAQFLAQQKNADQRKPALKSLRLAPFDREVRECLRMLGANKVGCTNLSINMTSDIELARLREDADIRAVLHDVSSLNLEFLDLAGTRALADFLCHCPSLTDLNFEVLQPMCKLKPKKIRKKTVLPLLRQLTLLCRSREEGFSQKETNAVHSLLCQASFPNLADLSVGFVPIDPADIAQLVTPQTQSLTCVDCVGPSFVDLANQLAGKNFHLRRLTFIEGSQSECKASRMSDGLAFLDTLRDLEIKSASLNEQELIAILKASNFNLQELSVWCHFDGSLIPILLEYCPNLQLLALHDFNKFSCHELGQALANWNKSNPLLRLEIYFKPFAFCGIEEVLDANVPQLRFKELWVTGYWCTRLERVLREREDIPCSVFCVDLAGGKLKIGP